MLHNITKSLSSSDVWGVIMLAGFIGMVFMLALSTNARTDHSYRLVVSSTPALSNPL